MYATWNSIVLWLWREGNGDWRSLLRHSQVMLILWSVDHTFSSQGHGFWWVLVEWDYKEKEYAPNPQMGQRWNRAGSHLHTGQESYSKLGTWLWEGKVRLRQWALQLASRPSWTFGFPGFYFPSLCSSELYRCESEDARGVCRECMWWEYWNFMALAAVKIQVLKLFTHLIKLLLSSCLVPGVMLGARDTSLHVWNFVRNLTCTSKTRIPDS